MQVDLLRGAPSGTPSGLSAVARAEERLTMANAFGGGGGGSAGGNISAGAGPGLVPDMRGCGAQHGHPAQHASGARRRRVTRPRTCLTVLPGGKAPLPPHERNIVQRKLPFMLAQQWHSRSVPGRNPGLAAHTPPS